MNINPELRASAKNILDEIKANDLYQGLDDKVSADPENVISVIAIENLYDNPNNHFHRIEGEAWDEFVGSIKEHGIFTPLIVREKDGRYEILAGHNRKYAAIEAGLKEVPCRIVEADDVDASVIVAVTNKQRENTTDLEWGWAYRTTYEAMKKTAGRHKKDESEASEEMVPTVGTIYEGKKTVDIVAEKYGVGKETIKRKIRLTYLIPQLYNLGASEKYSQKMMIDLSYLTNYEQDILTAMIMADKIRINEDIAATLRARSSEAATAGRQLEGSEIAELLKEEAVSEKKPPRPKRYSVDESLFPASIKKGERENYIFRALRYIIDNGVEIEM